MAHLYRVIRFPKGSDPRYLVWHHLWLSLGLTALGVLLGWLTLPLAAAADSELSSQALMDYYLQPVSYTHLLCSPCCGHCAH